MIITINRNPDGTFAKRKLGYKKKTCTGCGQYLYLREFYKYGKSKNFPDGYDCRCKQCRRKDANEAYARTRKIPDGIRLNADGQAVEKRGRITRLYWGEEKIKKFKRIYPFNTNNDVAIDMECSVRTVVRRAREMGLQKDSLWLQSVWNENRRLAHAVVKICGVKHDLTNFIESSKPYRFTSENHYSKYETKEQRDARIKKSRETRRKNKFRKKSIKTTTL